MKLAGASRPGAASARGATTSASRNNAPKIKLDLKTPCCHRVSSRFVSLSGSINQRFAPALANSRLDLRTARLDSAGAGQQVGIGARYPDPGPVQTRHDLCDCAASK